MTDKFIVTGDGFQAQIIEAERCQSKSEDHVESPRLAVAIVHWPTGPIRCCEDCARGLLQIARVLGVHVHVDKIALQIVRSEDRGHREIEL